MDRSTCCAGSCRRAWPRSTARAGAATCRSTRVSWTSCPGSWPTAVRRGSCRRSSQSWSRAMYCPECGFQNSEAANYCSKCGALIVPEQPGAQTTMSFAPAEFDADTAATAYDELHSDAPALVIRAGGGRAGEHFPLSSEQVSIGRSSKADILLDDVTVSRDHALVRRRPDGLYI